MNTIGKLATVLLALIFCTPINGQITGRITDNISGEPLPGAVVMWSVKDGTTTNSDGYYMIKPATSGSLTLTASFLGYETASRKVTFKQGEALKVNFVLVTRTVVTEPVVITATRTENRLSDVPARINTLSSKQISQIPASSSDELLAYIPGIQISRSFGILSPKSTVSMRGLSGKEQSRTLVLFDGIPINKTDGGSVNWNLLNTDQIERIEVIKGPGSALYGGNAMGGIINIISRKPHQKLVGKLATEYSTFNTPGARLSLSGREKPGDSTGFYWSVNGFARRSDGYVVQPEVEQTRYTTKSEMTEIMGGLKLGYDFNQFRNLEVDVRMYDDMRGSGEKVYQPDGNSTDHDTRHFRATYHDRLGKTDISATAFALIEDYAKVNEYMRDNSYTFYDVDSKRSDLGLLLNASSEVWNKHRLSAGIDLRRGAVDAADIYYTSTDKIINRGKMDFGAVYLQDEYSFLGGKGRLVAGLRFDYAHFHGGEFSIEYPSEINSFMAPYQINAIETTTWTAVSPKLGLQYKPTANTRIYTGYSRGFRPSILDDMCRSGRIRGGFKIANPNLKPETIDNIELGVDALLFGYLKASATSYYSLGHDFMYYTSTGQTIDMGYAINPISKRENISKVEIYGFEAEISTRPISWLVVFANYAYTHSQIKDYEVVNPLVDFNLTGKFLTDVAPNIFSAGVNINVGRIRAAAYCKYTDSMWINDSNGFDDTYLFAYKYPSVFQVDAKISVRIWKTLTASTSVQNVFDVKYYESKGSVNPGRFVTGEISYSF